MKRFGLHSSRVITTQGVKDATVVIAGHKIESVLSGHTISTPQLEIHDRGNSVIMPGLVDPHVHINEPGRTDWEGFDTATKAAAAGGITTLVDMPLNSTPVTTDAGALDEKVRAAKRSLHVNCGFHGGIIPSNLNSIEALVQGGVLGIKAFLTHSGIEDYPNVGEEHLRAVLPVLKRSGIPLLVHAEIDNPKDLPVALDRDPRSYPAYLSSRPRSWEDEAIKMLIGLAGEFDARIHIVHLSSSNSIDPLKNALKKGLPLSVETCPHYLVFNAEEIGDGQTLFKCAPPIRERENNEKLWDAIRKGLITMITTDHSPCPPYMKEISSGNFKKAWGGIAGLQFSLPAFWTSARERGFTLEAVAALMCRSTSALIGVDNRKGALASGYDADIVVWQPEKEFKVTQESIHHRHKISPYVGMELSGVVEETYVNGTLVYDRGDFPNLNAGEVILKKEA